VQAEAKDFLSLLKLRKNYKKSKITIGSINSLIASVTSDESLNGAEAV
jgi:hypothetical protein